MFARYFESELSYLRERGPELAAGPHQATMRRLLERGGDPDVERLVEAFAFLTARLRERLDQGAPEVIDALAEALAPHLLRGAPATAIVEIQPRIQALRGAQKIPRGRVMEAPTDRGVTCVFRSAADLELLPVEIADVAVKARRGEGFDLVIRLRVSEAGRALLAQPRALRLYLAGEPALARALRYALLGRCVSITSALVDPAGKVVSERALAPSAIQQVGLGDDEARLEWPALSPPGLRLLVEYFAAPELFHFVEIAGPLCAEGASGGEEIELRLHIAGAEALPGEVGPGSIRLHCVPVVNLFPATSEPIRLDARSVEHPLRVAGYRPGEVEVVAVTGVRSSRGGRAELREFRPLWGLGAPPPGSATYRLLRSPSPIDGSVDASLSLSAADDRPLSDLDGEVVHVDLLCTNRLLAGELGPGAIHREPRSGGLRFRNITPVSPPARAPLGPELRWRLLGHLAMGHASLADAESLRAYLAAHDLQRGTSRSAAARIAGIRRVEAQPITRIIEGAPLRGVETRIEIDASAFLGPGDVHLFGTILGRVLADRLGLNTFHELVLRLVPSEEELRWPAMSGGRALI